jgi:hypothetical protein
MKNLKEHWNISKYGKSKFKSDRSPLIDILYCKEVALSIDLIAILTFIVLDYPVGMSLLIAGAVHLFLVLFFAATSTILERIWKRKIDSRDNLRVTLDRLALNKERREKHGRKVGF